MIRLAVALFAVQAGFHGFTASLPVALARAGVPDPQIGLIVGTAALVQVPAAFAAGIVLDRLGAIRVFTVGALAYLIGCAILLLPGVEPGGPDLPFVIARLFQGIGIAGTLPAALSLVPRLVEPGRQGFGLAFVSSAHNLTLVALPPASLAILGVTSLHGVAAAVAGMVVAGIVILRIVPLRLRPAGEASETRPGGGPARPAAARRFGFAFRPAWTPLIAIILLYVAHWGVIVAYLPQRAEAAGADIGLFFAADGIAILAARVPTGWLADRTRPIVLIAAGLVVTALAVGLLALPPSTPLLVAAGLLSGGGAGLVMTPILVELSRRSDDADRGSAFSLFSAALAGALSIGSIGGAPIVGAYGFEAALLATLAGLAVAAIVTAADRGLQRRPTSAPGRG
ncbi:MAG TPA: MFS transporter [Candidatus Limnocylindrales bacterium]|nr:MFS transporter [Candidatus Limnocylindrales bacterium]